MHYSRCACVSHHRYIEKDNNSSNSSPLLYVFSPRARTQCTMYVFLRLMCTTMIDITHEQQQPLGYGDVKNRYGQRGRDG
jgi:hypothetical protein